MADNKTLGAIVGGALIIGAGIFMEKPAENAKQFEDAKIITASDAVTVAAHIDTVRKDSIIIEGKDTSVTSVVAYTVPVEERINRGQIATHIDSCFRPGDVFSVSYFRNDSLIGTEKRIVDESTYPKNGTLKIFGYCQWLETR
jgi:hypothetical protein